jgi:hypothetical protein
LKIKLKKPKKTLSFTIFKKSPEKKEKLLPVSGYLVLKLKNIKEWQTLLQNCSAKINKI